MKKIIIIFALFMAGCATDVVTKRECEFVCTSNASKLKEKRAKSCVCENILLKDNKESKTIEMTNVRSAD